MTKQKWINTNSLQRKLGKSRFNNRVIPLSKDHMVKLPVYHLLLAKNFWTRRDYQKITEEEREVYKSGLYLLEYELQIQSELYDKGFPVPKPEGIFDVQIEGSISRLLGVRTVRTGLVAQRLQGITNIQTIKDPEMKASAKRQYETRMDQLTEIGLKPSHDSMENTIFDPSSKKLYFIDFHMWDGRKIQGPKPGLIGIGGV